MAVAAAEPHGLQQELSCGEGWPGQGCSEPALPPSPRAVTILGGHCQLPLLPLARGRKAGASSASPLLILIPQVLSSHRARTTTKGEQSQGLVWHHGHGTPRECPGAAASPGWELLSPPCALGQLSPAEPSLQQSPVPSWLRGSPGHLCPCPGTEKAPGTSHRDQSHSKASSNPPFPYPSMVLGTKSHLPVSCRAGEAPAQGCASLAWLPTAPGCLLWPWPTLLLFIPGSSQGRDDAASPVCCWLDE